MTLEIQRTRLVYQQKDQGECDPIAWEDHRRWGRGFFLSEYDFFTTGDRVFLAGSAYVCFPAYETIDDSTNAQYWSLCPYPVQNARPEAIVYCG